MNAQDSFDVLIIGGGMAGASLACALTGRGLKIAVVEAVPLADAVQPSYDDRGLALSAASQRILEGIGVWPAVRINATPIEHIHVSERGGFGFTRIDADEFAVPALAHVAIARELGTALTARMRQAADCTVFCPAKLTGMSIGSERVEATLQTDGGERRLTASLLVGADGVESAVRRTLAIGVCEHDYHQTAIVANVTPSRPHLNTAYERFTPHGPVAMLPHKNDRCGVVWVQQTHDAAATMTLDDAAFLTGLQAQFGRRLGDLRTPGRRRAYPLKLLVAERVAGPRFALIGNAAHGIHPNGAQGFNLGLRDVAALAEVVVAARAAGADPGRETTMRLYADMRRADHKRTIRATDGLARIFYNDILPVKLLRNLSMVTIDMVPPLKQVLARGGSGLLGRQPRLVRGIPL
jgi:2-octaprenyl-6-methoxyphenol hydroxylase